MEIVPRFRNIFLEIFDAWNIRCAVVISLCFQILLIFLAPLRKRSGCKSGADDARAALWAPFMLLHLGGPDSITAFSLEDNELWIRHLVRLIVELVTVGYVFYLASPGDFWLIAILAFLTGAIKYGERTRALYLASLGTLKVSMLPQPDAGLNYAQLMEEQASMEEARSPVDTVITKEPERIAENVTVLRDERSSHEVIQVVQEGYRSYCNTLRGLIVDYMFSSFHERNESRRFFFGLKPNEAFGVMECVVVAYCHDLLYFTIDAPNQDDEPKPDHRQICKILSDYMLYLLVMRPTMMSEVAGISQIRFQDTCAEAMRFFHGGKSMSEQKEACEKLLSVNTRVKPVEVKGDKSKSLLFDACILAKDLRTVDRDEMWEMMSKVWLESALARAIAKAMHMHNSSAKVGS
ncbi:hypothetical protein DH2020_033547 [Rehmannia glutinosa]|uniref:DUF4220 domain-containing protein n=1 Tax=Rehmannia glutinosa TaxID=99300 RepID=A0ABR0VCZ1_REHGL